MTQITIKEETSFGNEDWYRGLFEDCDAINTERRTNVRIEKIEERWEIGQRIIECNSNIKKDDVESEKIIQNLANDLGETDNELWNCVNFYKHVDKENFEDVVPILPEGKNITWKKAKIWSGEVVEKKDRIKRSYKLIDVLEVYKMIIISKGVSDEEEIEKQITEFKESIVNYKKED